MLSPGFNAATSYVGSRFARRAMEYLGCEGLPFGVALKRTVDLFPSIDRGKLRGEWLNLFGVNDDADGFHYETSGELFKAFQVGIHAGVEKIPLYFPTLDTKIIDYGPPLQALHDCIAPSEYSGVEALSSTVRMLYVEIFDRFDGARIDGLSPCAANAQRAFLIHFGLTVADDRGDPVVWW